MCKELEATNDQRVQRNGDDTDVTGSNIPRTHTQKLINSLKKHVDMDREQSLIPEDGIDVLKDAIGVLAKLDKTPVNVTITEDDEKRFLEKQKKRDAKSKREKDIITLEVLAKELILFSKDKDDLIRCFIDRLIPIYANISGKAMTYDEMRKNLKFIATEIRFGQNYLKTIRSFGNL